MTSYEEALKKAEETEQEFLARLRTDVAGIIGMLRPLIGIQTANDMQGELYRLIGTIQDRYQWVTKEAPVDNP